MSGARWTPPCRWASVAECGLHRGCAPLGPTTHSGMCSAFSVSAIVARVIPRWRMVTIQPVSSRLSATDGRQMARPWARLATSVAEVRSARTTRYRTSARCLGL